MNATQPYSLGILAGGQGARWGGRDKGLIAQNGQSLIAGITHARPTAAQELLVCCRSYPHFYQHFRLIGCCAKWSAGLGPCAGIVALLSAVKTPTLMVLPVDLIGSPQEIIQATLEHEWREDDTATFSSQTPRAITLPAFGFMPTRWRLAAFLDAGGRKITGLLKQIEHDAVQVDALWLHVTQIFPSRWRPKSRDCRDCWAKNKPWASTTPSVKLRRIMAYQSGNMLRASSQTKVAPDTLS